MPLTRRPWRLARRAALPAALAVKLRLDEPLQQRGERGRGGGARALVAAAAAGVLARRVAAAPRGGGGGGGGREGDRARDLRERGTFRDAGRNVLSSSPAGRGTRPRAPPRGAARRARAYSTTVPPSGARAEARRRPPSVRRASRRRHSSCTSCCCRPAWRSHWNAAVSPVVEHARAPSCMRARAPAAGGIESRARAAAAAAAAASGRGGVGAAAAGRRVRQAPAVDRAAETRRVVERASALT